MKRQSLVATVVVVVLPAPEVLLQTIFFPTEVHTYATFLTTRVAPETLHLLPAICGKLTAFPKVGAEITMTNPNTMATCRLVKSF